jgi:hypothetical protein
VEQLSSPEFSGYRNLKGATLGGQPLRALNTGNMNAWAVDGPFDLYKRENFARGPHIGWPDLLSHQIDLFRVTPPASGKLALLATLLRCDRPQVLRLDTGDPAARAWVGGKAVTHNQALALPQGQITFVLSMPLDAAADRTLAWRPRLWPSQGSADRAVWRKQIERIKPYLETVLTLCPDSEIAQRAGKALAVLKEK